MHLILFIMVLVISLSVEPTSNSCGDQKITYMVEEGDNLNKVSAQFGSYRFWEALYIYNADLISNPNRIFPGQEIRIPTSIAKFNDSENSISDVLQNPFCNISELPIENIDSLYLSMYSVSSLESKIVEEKGETEQASNDVPAMKDEELEAFRNAFEAVMSEAEKQEEVQEETERSVMIELDGMIHDETRSKIGRDFYDVFYTFWQSPPEANNFTIYVNEYPAPSRGTVVSVRVNDSETFKMRLQPRYEMIEEASKNAVRATYRHLQDNRQETMIY